MRRSPEAEPAEAPAEPETADAAGEGRVKLLLWHGYLLTGTGSNIYARMLAREWSREATT